MEVTLDLSPDCAHVVQNMWPAYQHDLTEFGGERPNAHGLLHADDDVRTMAEHLAAMAAWWREPERLFPYLIRVDGQPAGFNLVAARARLPEGIDADFVVHEFFVVHAYRGSDVAERAARLGFERHPGSWEVVTYPNHARAAAFWRRTCRGFSSDSYSEDERDHVWGRKLVFTFDNSGR